MYFFLPWRWLKSTGDAERMEGERNGGDVLFSQGDLLTSRYWPVSVGYLDVALFFHVFFQMHLKCLTP